MDVRADLARAIERARLELRARMGGMRKQKKLKKLGRPAKTGPGAGCGTGSGGFQSGNNCALEDGIPQKPFAKGGALKKANPKQLKAEVQAQKQKTAAKVAAKEAAQKKKGLLIRRKNAAARKQEKEAKAAEEAKKASEAAAAKKKAFVQGLRIKQANEQVKIAGTPKSVKEQLDEAKASMKAKTAAASKQLTVAGTPKSLKQEIEELKASKANAALKVVGTPKSVKQELDELKARQAAKKEAAPKKPPQEQAAGAHLGQQHLVKQNKSDQGKLNEERDAVFGKDLRAGWESPYGGGADVAIKAKINLSIDKAKRLDKIGIKEEDIDDEMLLIMDPYKRYHGSQSAEDRLDSSGVPKEYRRRYALSAGMTDSWAGTSGDSNPTAVGIQYAIKDEFGVAKAYTRHLSSKDKSKNGKQAWDERISKVRKNKAVRAVLRAQYESTQDWFRAQGVAKVTLVRGYSSSAKINPTSEQNVSMQPASSFSMSKGIAQKFAEEGGPSKARHLTATVDVSRILSTARTGFGCLNEQELTILGGVIQGRVVNKPFDW